MIFQIAVAYLLDVLIGDPGWFPHPVKGMGYLIRVLEKIFYRLCFNLRASGVAVALILVGLSWAGGFFALLLASKISGWLEFALGSFLIFTSLSINDLAKEAQKVHKTLIRNDIEFAREMVGRIVGRDTGNLSESDIIRGAVESIAENTVDGVISPLFYAFIGGAPLALAYKAINTLDSMLGYQDNRYFKFGWFSARLDDLANFIPARLSLLFVPLAACFLRKRGGDSLRILLRDGKKSPSPNAGIPEAGFSGALGVRLGGVNFYQGRREEKPLIGENRRELVQEDIHSAIRIMQIVSFISLFIFGAVWWIFAKLV